MTTWRMFYCSSGGGIHATNLAMDGLKKRGWCIDFWKIGYILEEKNNFCFVRRLYFDSRHGKIGCFYDSKSCIEQGWSWWFQIKFPYSLDMDFWEMALPLVVETSDYSVHQPVRSILRREKRVNECNRLHLLSSETNCKELSFLF